jgi:hypothetical protein
LKFQGVEQLDSLVCRRVRCEEIGKKSLLSIHTLVERINDAQVSDVMSEQG